MKLGHIRTEAGRWEWDKKCDWNTMGLGHNGTGTTKGQGHNEIGTRKNGGLPSGHSPLGMGQKNAPETQRDWDTVGQEHGRAITKQNKNKKMGL